MLLLVTSRQKVNSHSMLCHMPASFTSLWSLGWYFSISPQCEKGGYRTIRYSERERNHIHMILLQCIVIIVLFCYCCSFLSVPHLEIKPYRRYTHIGKNRIDEIWYYLWFQASIGGLGMYPLRIRGGDDCNTIHLAISRSQIILNVHFNPVSEHMTP